MKCSCCSLTGLLAPFFDEWFFCFYSCCWFVNLWWARVLMRYVRFPLSCYHSPNCQSSLFSWDFFGRRSLLSIYFPYKFAKQRLNTLLKATMFNSQWDGLSRAWVARAILCEFGLSWELLWNFAVEMFKVLWTVNHRPSQKILRQPEWNTLLNLLVESTSI